MAATAGVVREARIAGIRRAATLEAKSEDTPVDAGVLRLGLTGLFGLITCFVPPAVGTTTKQPFAGLHDAEAGFRRLAPTA